MSADAIRLTPDGLAALPPGVAALLDVAPERGGVLDARALFDVATERAAVLDAQARREAALKPDAPAWISIIDRVASEADYVVTGKRAIEIVLLDGGHVVFLADTGGALCAGVISEPAGAELKKWLCAAMESLGLPLFAIMANGLAELTPVRKGKPA